MKREREREKGGVNEPEGISGGGKRKGRGNHRAIFLFDRPSIYCDNYLGRVRCARRYPLRFKYLHVLSECVRENAVERNLEKILEIMDNGWNFYKNYKACSNVTNRYS